MQNRTVVIGYKKALELLQSGHTIKWTNHNPKACIFSEAGNHIIKYNDFLKLRKEQKLTVTKDHLDYIYTLSK
jgi:hypothetical protein